MYKNRVIVDKEQIDGMTIDNIKHCLKVMVDCEVCEECNLYGTTGTDHCEHDCVYGALDIIDKYQKIQEIVENRNIKPPLTTLNRIIGVVENRK